MTTATVFSRISDRKVFSVYKNKNPAIARQFTLNRVTRHYIETIDGFDTVGRAIEWAIGPLTMAVPDLSRYW